jgi:phage anti-repressor protein
MEKKIETGLLVQSNNEMLVDARLLHRKLQVSTKFTVWIQRRIIEFGFESNKDFFPIMGKTKGGRKPDEYHLTVDMAKELAMLERNETGRGIRRYFIAAEKEARLHTLGHTALPGAVVKSFARLAATINGRRLYPYRNLLLHIGTSTGGNAYKRCRLYPNHFVEFNGMMYCTEEMAGLIYAGRQVTKLRHNVRLMDPVLPLGFGETLALKGL